VRTDDAPAGAAERASDPDARDAVSSQRDVPDARERLSDHESEGAHAVISVRRLAKVYRMGQTSIPALRGVNVEVARGEFVAIMGPSGSGKSTFMNLLGCLDRPTSGEYWLNGREVSRLSADAIADLRNRHIGFVFQGFNLLARATALANVALPLLYAGMPREERERRARRALRIVGLGNRLEHHPQQLSGGQQQRVAIARALVNSPSLLLADEPTGNLDTRTGMDIMAILQRLNGFGLTIVLVTHEADIAAYAQRQISFRDGLVVSDQAVTQQRSATDELQELLARRSAGGAGGEPVRIREEHA
jgi:putative ABC transport system ATP-binding protein